MAEVKGRGKNIASLRNLPQFRGKTDEEIQDILANKPLEGEVAHRIEKLGEEYDLSDMKYHDSLLLERMMTLIVRLERDEKKLNEAIEDGALTELEANNAEKRLSTMRNDLLRIQTELGIGRLKRAQEVQDNPIILFSDIRARARKFLDNRLCWVKCPECGMMLAKVNFTYPTMDNRMILTCGRDGCGHQFTITSQEALEAEGANPYK